MDPLTNRINVTETFLPNIKEYKNILSKSWDKRWITNRGKLVCELENKIKKKFQISNIILTTNGTLPLQIAIKTLELKGEIITTPFSYIATTSSIIWEGCTPVFSDIDVNTFNINPDIIEDNITDKTVAIIATHVFGNPCEIDKIEIIAKKYNLKVIYDAAHCFGTQYKEKSIFEYGDISTCSFHATKIFHTGEGGAIFSKDGELHKKLFYHHNFGHKGKDDFFGLGINAKMNELQAALGLTILPYFDDIINKRKKLYKTYQEELGEVVKFQKINFEANYNYSYMPVIFSTEKILLNCIEALNNVNIFPRRYFHPSLNTIEYVSGKNMPVSESISQTILCLPLYYNLTKKDVVRISKIILKAS